MLSRLNERNSVNKIRYIESLVNGKSYIAAKVLINISATLYGLKPASLLTFSRRVDRDSISLWDKYKTDIVLEQNLEFIELKRDHNNLVVLFYNRYNLTTQVFDRKHLRFLERFGYSGDMTVDEMLNHLKERYHCSCPHEIGIFLGIPLKDVLGYLQLIPLECSYCGYWKVYGNPEKTKKLFQKLRNARHDVINLIYSGEDPVKLLRKHSFQSCKFEERNILTEVG